MLLFSLLAWGFLFWYAHNHPIRGVPFRLRGGGGDDKEEAPKYEEDPYTTQIKAALAPKVTELAGKSYEDWLKRFSPSDEVNQLATDAVKRYQSLFDTQDYSLTDYSKTENDYLDTVVRKYNESRSDAFKPVQESLIAENLFSSGPGYGIMTDFGKETAQGVGDITKQWAYEGIARQQQQVQYQDALKRGDYSTMYNLALSEQNRQMQPVQQASQAELSAIGAGSGLFGQLSQTDLSKYNAAMQTYQAQLAQEEDSNMGGLGSALGMGLGALLALPTGGMSVLGGAALGGGIGGGLGSMF